MTANPTWPWGSLRDEKVSQDLFGYESIKPRQDGFIYDRDSLINCTTSDIVNFEREVSISET